MRRVAVGVVLVAALVGLATACKDTPAPPPPKPLAPAEILQHAFAPDPTFVPAELTFQGVKPDGTYDLLVVHTRRKPTGGPFDPKSLYNCPTTTYRRGVPTLHPNDSCASAFGRPLALPRCSLVEIWARAIEEGAKPTAAKIVYEYRQTPLHDGPTWELQADRNYVYDDDCAPNVEAGGTFAKRLPTPVAAPAHVDDLTHAALAWLAEKHPSRVIGRIFARDVTPDGTLVADGEYRFEPAVIWPDDKPKLHEHHYGGSAPYGVCRALLWTAKRGWHLDEYEYSCADVEAAPRCTARAVLERAGTGGALAYDAGRWTVGALRVAESELACP